MKIYSAQLIAMAGMLIELIVKGGTALFFLFVILFSIVGTFNIIMEIKDAIEDKNES